MKNQKNRSLTAITLLAFASAAWANAPTPGHQSLTQALESARDWAMHLHSETLKGKSADRAHVKKEIQGIQDAMKMTNDAYDRLGAESPSDLQEGHFVALKAEQQKASSLAQELADENAKAKPDYPKMRKISKNIVSALDEARHQHDLELKEIERTHHPG